MLVNTLKFFATTLYSFVVLYLSIDKSILLTTMYILMQILYIMRSKPLKLNYTVVIIKIFVNYLQMIQILFTFRLQFS